MLKFLVLCSLTAAYIIPGWHIQSSDIVGNDTALLSSLNYDSSSWYSVGSRSTITAGLIEAGVYNDSDLFYSDNLKSIDKITTPWYYRHQFDFTGPAFLFTNGITSKADIFLNGMLIANSTTQAGAYTGHEYDITHHLNTTNVLLVKVYPTDYNKDFASSFVDWNPYPPDNGTGIWRDVEIKQSSMSELRITTNFTGTGPVEVTAKVNSQGAEVEFELNPGAIRMTTTSPGIASTTIDNPQIWWPKQWGDQPLYTVTARTGNDSLTRTFGIRQTSSKLNDHGDRVFSINGNPFQVLGAGYSPDIFLRFDPAKVKAQFQYVLDMDLNTIRLEGKQEQPEFYDIADQMGLMILAGWECCDKWEAWSYNEDVDATLWSDADYGIARASMRHEAAMMQPHPSMLSFLVGSDYWPDDRAAQIYVDTLHELDWQNPIVASASMRGYPDILGPGGMKMDGPYDWVSPNYWWYGQLGAAFGFGSELGAGVGTPEISSLKKFLSTDDLAELWTSNGTLYHMSNNGSVFDNRAIYNQALYTRYGAPTSLEDYLLKAQMMDYEATRAQFEAYSSLWSADRPATGMIYWMLNNAWPSLHWNLFDYYLHPAGSYFGAKTGSKFEHVAYDSVNSTIWLINHSLNRSGSRSVEVSLIDLQGDTLYEDTLNTITEPNMSRDLHSDLNKNLIHDMALLKLIVSDDDGSVLSRNVYWLSAQDEVLDWDNSIWYNTPTTNFTDFTALNTMQDGDVDVQVLSSDKTNGYTKHCLQIHNLASIPAVFIRLNLADGQDITPVFWSDNYFTLWPEETVLIQLEHPDQTQPLQIQLSGKNIQPTTIALPQK